jgi:hypothetical protein
MKRTLFAVLLLAAGCAAQSELSRVAPSHTLLSYSDRITPEFLQQHLEVIAHDSLEGRATGMRGQKIAADYLADFYSALGIRPKGDNGSYFQTFRLNAEYTDSLVYATYSVSTGDTLRYARSVEAKEQTGEFIRMFGGSEPLKGDIVFAGFGLNDDENGVFHLEDADMSGSWVMIFEDIPYVVDGDTLVNPDISSNSRIRSILVEKNAAGILLISDYTRSEFDELASISARLISNPSGFSLPYLEGRGRATTFPNAVVQISPDKAATYLGLQNAGQLHSTREELISGITKFRAQKLPFLLDYTPFEGPGYIETENVLAFIEGSDPERKHETLVLVAHYDHIGITQPDESGDPINNGADDNGSGTVALMNIAKAMQSAANDGYRPARSVLFLHVSAEEVGLLGSRYYSDHPVVPIENTVAAFNADMIGRSDPENIRRGDTDYVYLIGGEIISSGLDSLVQAGNRQSVNMRLDRRYNDLQDPNQFYRRSDHWNFGRLSVPFVFFFTGVHEDYHRPSDTVDKVDFDKLSRVTTLIYSSVIEVTNYEGRPEVDNEEFIEITRRMPR